MSEKIWYIYALRDPETLYTAYIGRTINPKIRLQAHRCSQKHPRVRAWVDSLGCPPRMDILATASSLEEADRLESATIRKYRERSSGLMNISCGVVEPGAVVKYKANNGDCSIVSREFIRETTAYLYVNSTEKVCKDGYYDTYAEAARAIVDACLDEANDTKEEYARCLAAAQRAVALLSDSEFPE